MTTKASRSPESAVYRIDQGNVIALAGGPLSLANMGPRTTRRVSTIEFANLIDEWVVSDAETKEILFTHPDYDAALEWERSEFNRRLSVTD